MNFFLRAPVLRVFFPVVAAILCVCEISWAQSQEKPAEPAKTQTTSGPAKPVHKPDWVTTNDPVALLAVRRAPRIVEAPSGEPAVAGSGTAVDATTKRGEIAELERQIQSKQKRIALLMRLFV